jgi:hypothetical protein
VAVDTGHRNERPLDRQPATLTDERQGSTTERDIVYVSGPLASGTHSIQVTEISGSIALDGLVVLG